MNGNIPVLWDSFTNGSYKTDYPGMFRIVADVVSSARDLTVFWQDLINLYRDVLMVKTAPSVVPTLDLSPAETEELQSLAARLTRERLLYHSRLLENAFSAMSRTSSGRLALVP